MARRVALRRASHKGEDMDILKENSRLIDARIEAGLALLRERFDVRECEVDPILASPVIGGRPHHARRFEVEGVGNLLVMTVTEAKESQLSSFVITPYGKDLPLFSTDYVYSGEKRFFLIEIYDLTIEHTPVYEGFMDVLSKLSATWDDMPGFPVRPCWYDGIRPLCIAKAPDRSQDDLAIERFLEALRAYADAAACAPALAGEDLEAKWRLNKGYSDRLIDEGGVSTELFVEAIGAENTRRFFDEVFFGPSLYRPAHPGLSAKVPGSVTNT